MKYLYCTISLISSLLELRYQYAINTDKMRNDSAFLTGENYTKTVD
ncbi:MAG TPA: hypothetical protein PL188_06975 [Candidatus Cloacimonadota bacterium]|nr:hypothetical protein [Candidatus Cloacimonadota bacterium]